MPNTTLCQTAETSCIACCMNAYLNIPKSELEEVFGKRARVLNESDGPLDYQKRIEREEQNVPFCKFLGYLDSENNIVGCIIHPDHIGTENDLRKDPAVRREVCLSRECDSSKVFRRADEKTQDEINNFLSGMHWYRFSHFIAGE